MVAIQWDSTTRPYLAGVDQGVLYPVGQIGVPWNGLVSVTDKPSDVVEKDYYLDGVRYAFTQTTEDYSFQIQAYTYPDEFGPCIGFDGIYENQRHQSFGLSFRTGDDLTGQIHLVYNALVTPSDKNWQTLSDSPDAALFSWEASTRPVAIAEGAPTSHVVIELSEIYPVVKTALYNKLYGTSSTNPVLPPYNELYSLFESNADLIVVDNGNGTWTATGLASVISILSPTTFQINSPGVIVIDADTYRLRNY